LSAVVGEVRPDVILSDQDPATAEGMQLKAAAWLGRIPIVFCNVENVDRRYSVEAFAAFKNLQPVPGVLSLGIDLLIRWSYRWNNTAMWSMNRAGIDIVKAKRGFRGPVVHAPLGIDASLFKPARDESMRKSLALGSPTFGQFGRLSPEKGIFHLLEAAARLKDRFDFKILIDSLKELDSASFAKEVLDRACTLDLAGRLVRFTATHDEMPRYYNAIDCLVAPSHPTARGSEQYGRVVAEALGCGVPVIVSDCGHLPDLVGSFGEVFPAGDVGQLAERMERFLTDAPSFRARAEAGRQYFLEHLSSTAHARILTRLFLDMLDNRASRC
jgi:glycosyltransferase involved in cell wall biosynthesis